MKSAILLIITTISLFTIVLGCQQQPPTDHEPADSFTPEPETSLTPEPETSSTPEPETSSTPEPETSSTPEPETSSTPEPSYEGPLFDSHLHTRNILQPHSAETLLNYLDREGIDYAVCFNIFPSSKISSLMPIVESIGDRVIMLRGGTSIHTGDFSETELRRYLQPRGPLWGFGEIGLWHEEFQNVTFDSPQMQTIFRLANEVKGIVMIHMSGGRRDERPTELTEIEPAICNYPDAIFLFHSINTFDVVAQLMSKYPNVYYSMDFGASFFKGKGVSLKPTDADYNNAESFLAAVNEAGLDYIVERNLQDLAPLILQYPDRIFWGTDFSEPWHFEESVTDLVVSISRKFIGRLPADIQKKYAYQNALQVFGHFLTPKE